MLQRVRWIVMALLVGLALVPPAFASVQVFDENGLELGHAQKLRNCRAFINDTCYVANAEMVVGLPINGAILVNHSTDIATPVAITTTPGYAMEDGTQPVFVEWADNEVDPIQFTFRVPAGYVSGGKFRVWVGRSGVAGSNTPPTLAWQVFVNTSGGNSDTSATTQTSVTLTNSAAGGTQEQVVLTPTTDFDSLTAGQLVTLELWRDNSETSTASLEVYYAEFFTTD